MTPAEMLQVAQRWLREHGLAPSGFVFADWVRGAVLIWTFAPLRRARWEVYSDIAELGFGPINSPGDFEEWLAPLPVGSLEALHRLDLGARLVCVTRDQDAARAALQGER